MKHLLLLFLLTMLNTAFGQDYKTLINTANAHYRKKEYTESVTDFKAAFKIEAKNPSHLYDAACAAALAKEEKTAFQWLDLALKNGYTNIRHLKTDEDLTALYNTKKWTKFLDKMQKVVDKKEANYDKPLQAQLLAILEEDQKYRQKIEDVEAKYTYNSQEMRDLWKTINQKDSLNLIEVQKILDTKGWVGPDKIGGAANSTLFYVIQHANHKTQLTYLPMMREAVKNGNADASSLALLEDRTAIGEGKRQIYGSQISKNGTTQKYYIMALDDPDNVDKRRAEVGLGRISEYVIRWGIVWDVEAYKKELPEIEAQK
jgi:hypothetical protein